MQLKALLKHLRQCGCRIKREGNTHNLWVLDDDRLTAIPHQVVIAERLAERICRDLQVPGVGESLADFH